MLVQGLGAKASVYGATGHGVVDTLPCVQYLGNLKHAHAGRRLTRADI